MISMDTNILLPLVVQDHPPHLRAAAFAESLQGSDGVAISKLREKAEKDLIPTSARFRHLSVFRLCSSAGWR
jgi:predicted nucleic acid-binding protein